MDDKTDKYSTCAVRVRSVVKHRAESGFKVLMCNGLNGTDW